MDFNRKEWCKDYGLIYMRRLCSYSLKMPRTSSKSIIEKSSIKDESFETPSLTDKPLRMSYRIAKGEQGVLTFEPYKSMILPLWRFRTPDIAHKSSQDLWQRFEDYDEAGDFVGMDMTRKFIQMGMTRAKRYANHAGGRKYDKKTGVELEKSNTHKDYAEKLEASNIFREVWLRTKEHEGYAEKKARFLAEQKDWDKEHPSKKDKFTGQVIKEQQVKEEKIKQEDG